MNLIKHLEYQKQWSENTFGPGPRTQGVCDHIRKELKEIEAKPTDLFEWIDVVILALDGAWRAGYSSEQIVAALEEKQNINEARNWPDWRTAEPGKAIEHIKTTGPGHILYVPADFTDGEIERQNKLALMVRENGLDVCRKCGEYEAGLNTPCKSVYDFLAIEKWKNER